MLSLSKHWAGFFSSLLSLSYCPAGSCVKGERTEMMNIYLNAIYEMWAKGWGNGNLNRGAVRHAESELGVHGADLVRDVFARAWCAGTGLDWNNADDRAAAFGFADERLCEAGCPPLGGTSA